MGWSGLEESEKGYIAGFLDGEGAISLSKQENGNSVYYRPQIAFYNTDGEVIKWIGSKLDGVEYSIDTRDDSRHNKDCFVLSVRKQKDIYDLVKNLKPYLITKKEQAELMEDFLGSLINRDSRSYTEELRSDLKSMTEEMKELNR